MDAAAGASTDPESLPLALFRALATVGRSALCTEATQVELLQRLRLATLAAELHLPREAVLLLQQAPSDAAQELRDALDFKRVRSRARLNSAELEAVTISSSLEFQR
jgi:hypothetical protein